MIDWHWEIQEDQGNTYWVSIVNSNPWAWGSVVVICVKGPEIKSKYIGQEVIGIAIETDPIQTQLYKLVYGRLP